MTLGAVCLTALLQIVQNQSWGYRFVQNIGAVRAEDPLWLALLRTPLSLFVPALDLPVWGALAQILVVFGIAEICLGRWRTLRDRVRRHAGRHAVRAGGRRARPGRACSGCPRRTRRSSTPGRRRPWWGSPCSCAGATGPGSPAAVVIAAMVVEVVVKDNLAGKEHLAAIVAVLVLCGVSALARPAPPSARPPRSGLAHRGRDPVGRAADQSSNLRRGAAQRRSWR